MHTRQSFPCLCFSLMTVLHPAALAILAAVSLVTIPPSHPRIQRRWPRPLHSSTCLYHLPPEFVSRLDLSSDSRCINRPRLLNKNKYSADIKGRRCADNDRYRQIVTPRPRRYRSHSRLVPRRNRIRRKTYSSLCYIAISAIDFPTSITLSGFSLPEWQTCLRNNASNAPDRLPLTPVVFVTLSVFL